MALDNNTIPLVLESMGLAALDWGPDVSSYAALKAGWRGGKGTLPTEAAMTAAEADAVAAQAAKEQAARPLDAEELAALLIAKGTISAAEVTAKKGTRQP